MLYFSLFRNKHAENPHLARLDENADVPLDYNDKGGYNIGTIRMLNQYTATGSLLSPSTNNEMGLQFRATEYKMMVIDTDLDVFMEYCNTPDLVKLFIHLKQEEYANKKLQKQQQRETDKMNFQQNVEKQLPFYTQEIEDEGSMAGDEIARVQAQSEEEYNLACEMWALEAEMRGDEPSGLD
ncbi:hypothetical protein T492DRAFT_836849 [Pavlovales sp. CCMP2436]|nr:hypothetical protein T492DRAFT_836849 [Pavlovales sp. CCMP2436]